MNAYNKRKALEEFRDAILDYSKSLINDGPFVKAMFNKDKAKLGFRVDEERFLIWKAEAVIAYFEIDDDQMTRANAHVKASSRFYTLVILGNLLSSVL